MAEGSQDGVSLASTEALYAVRANLHAGLIAALEVENPLEIPPGRSSPPVASIQLMSSLLQRVEEEIQKRGSI